ncbi:MAG: phosphoribosylglycinamide formyltransferase [Roseburia sp.]|nr:phosphoribosylglycinamide formyltransferase [Roseburia sp.]MCM1241996.1 phosphoribosylglycinamide formyltransferase [Roseburia sp.]
MLRVVVCVSGGGTNLQALLDGIGKGKVTNTQIVRVISNNRDAYALTRAKMAGIEEFYISPKDYVDREQFYESFLEAVDEAEPDLIVLAGFLVVLPPKMTEKYQNRIINIHPSLIPSFCGKGFYGLKVHKEALKKGVKVTGATVHFVDEGTDTGPIILQKAVSVQEDDTPESLQQRVMEEAEWQILPQAVDLIANGRVTVHGGRVRIDRGQEESEDLRL